MTQRIRTMVRNQRRQHYVDWLETYGVTKPVTIPRVSRHTWSDLFWPVCINKSSTLLAVSVAITNPSGQNTEPES